jgi:hypothetical protein
MSRLIATETRISNIERVLEQFGKMHPVIIE